MGIFICLTTLTILILKINALHLAEIESEASQDSCLIQIINKYIHEKSVILSRPDKQMPLQFPFNETKPFIINDVAKGPYISFEDTINKTTDLIIFSETTERISVTLKYIWKNMIWNFNGKHMIVLRKMSSRSLVEDSVTRMNWEGYLRYNIVIAFHDESNVLQFYVWFPTKSDQGCGGRKDLEYLGACKEIKEDPFTMGVYEKLRLCPFKLAVDYVATNRSMYVYTQILDSFIKKERIFSR